MSETIQEELERFKANTHYWLTEALDLREKWEHQKARVSELTTERDKQDQFRKNLGLAIGILQGQLSEAQANVAGLTTERDQALERVWLLEQALQTAKDLDNAWIAEWNSRSAENYAEYFGRKVAIRSKFWTLVGQIEYGIESGQGD